MVISCFIIVIIVSFLVFKINLDTNYTNDSSVNEEETEINEVGGENEENEDAGEIDTDEEQVNLDECYFQNPFWTKVTNTVVRDIAGTHTATISKDIYCDDNNCIFWTDRIAIPTTVCVATDNNVYGNILWSKTDEKGTYVYGERGTPLFGDRIGGTHPVGLTVGKIGTDISNNNWLSMHYSSGDFPAMVACRAKGEGWRLPTILELDSIRDQGKDSPPHSGLPNISNYYYWSSTESINYRGAYGAYYLYFYNGVVLGTSKLSTINVRCVRE